MTHPDLTELLSGDWPEWVDQYEPPGCVPAVDVPEVPPAAILIAYREGYVRS